MMNTMMKKSPNQVPPIPRRNDEIDNDDGIIYPPGYSVASPISINDPNSLPLAPAVLIQDHNTHNAEEGRVSSTQNSEESHSKKTDSRFDPFQPIHPQCNHISYGCLTMVFLVFVGIAVLLKTYLPDILHLSNDDESVIPSIDNENIKSYDSYQPSSPPSISTEPTPYSSFLPTVTRSNPPSMYLSHPPSITRNKEKKLVASDGSGNDMFGVSCSMSDELVVVGATGADEDKGAAYLFHLDGTEVMKLTTGNDGEEIDRFGNSISMDEKIVVGTWNADYVDVFSRQGIYERTITCDGCNWFGNDVATLGNLIVMDGTQNSIEKLFVFSTEGRLLNAFEQESHIYDIKMSEQFIVSTALNGKTFIYSNTSPEFPKIAEINQGGDAVAVSSDRIVM